MGLDEGDDDETTSYQSETSLDEFKDRKAVMKTKKIEVGHPILENHDNQIGMLTVEADI